MAAGLRGCRRHSSSSPSAYGDGEGRARTEVKPAHLADAAPECATREFSNLSDPLTVVAESDGFDLSPVAQAIDWSDGLISQIQVIFAYDHPHFGCSSAVVSTEHGQGRITTVGTLPNPALAADLRWLAPRAQDQTWTGCRRQ